MSKKSLLIFITIILILIIYGALVFAFPFVYSGYYYKTVPPKNLVNFNILNPLITNNSSLKVAAIGDSTGIGQGTDSDTQSFGYQYTQTYLLPNYSFINYSNFSQSGNFTSDVLQNQIPKVETDKYDIIFVSIGSNDMISSKTNKAEFTKNVSKLVDKLISTKAKIIWLSIPDFITVPTLLFPLNLYLSNRSKQFNQETTKILDTNKLQLIDVYDATRQPFLDNPNKYFSKDKYHPSKDGYNLWVEAIKKQLK